MHTGTLGAKGKGSWFNLKGSHTLGTVHSDGGADPWAAGTGMMYSTEGEVLVNIQKV